MIFCDFLQLFAKNRNFRVSKCQWQSQGYFCPMDYLILDTTARRRMLWAVLSRLRRCTLRSPLLPTTVSNALALLLVTTSVLTRTALLPSARLAPGTSTLVWQQRQQQQQHRPAAAYPTNYSSLSHSLRVPPAATSSSSTAT